MQNDPRPLHLHTLESLCVELINGKSVKIPNGTFLLQDDHSKAVLNWYYRNRNKWAGRMSENDADSIANCLTQELAAPAFPEAPTTKTNGKRLKIVKVQAHRFGGIHAYGTESSAPADFSFEPQRNLTLFEGPNGSGKTSLLNTIVWCLTGSLLRAQREPSEGAEEFDCLVSMQNEEGKEDFSSHGITPVTPLPDPALSSLSVGQAVAIDTWVEITFEDETGAKLPPVRRTQARTIRGKVTESCPSFESLAIDPISVNIATVMPSILHHVQIGKQSDLGQAVSELTGLSKLTDLRNHSSRAANYLNTTARTRRENEISNFDTQFNEARTDLESRLMEFPKMKPEAELPKPSADKEIESQLEELKKHFQSAKSDALESAKTILGDGFDPNLQSERDELEKNIEPAVIQLSRLKDLESAMRLASLGELKVSDVETTNAQIEAILEEANTLAELAKNPDLAKREQLYARLASWMKNHDLDDTTTCQVCLRNLSGIVDPVSSESVTEHLNSAMISDANLVSQAASTWVSQRKSNLLSSLPESLRKEVERDLPTLPSDLIAKALKEELFATDPFKGVLQELQKSTEKLCQSFLPSLPDFTEPKVPILPEIGGSDLEPLQQLLKRITRAIAFAEWRQNSSDEIKSVFQSIVGKKTTDANAEEVTEDSTIRTKLEAISDIIEGSQPITDAIKYCDRMDKALKSRRTVEKLLSSYNQAIKALGEVGKLGELAEAQVKELQSLLGTKAQLWRDKIYQDAVSSTHKLRRTEMSTDGKLDFHVGSEKITAPAQHVANASSLRASLIGFFLAFREHILKVRGGFDFLVLDDPQELLDHHNREKMGGAIAGLAIAGSQIFLSSYNRQFSQIIAEEGKTVTTHFSVHPINARRSTLELALSKIELDKKAGKFRSELDDHGSARDYANEVRIYLETRLGDLFDDPTYPAFAATTNKPGLSDKLDVLRNLVASSVNDLFAHNTVRNFSNHPDLQSTSECYKLMNDAHHQPDNVNYGRVSAVADNLVSLRKGIDQVHQTFRHFRWKSGNVDNDNNADVVVLNSVSPTPALQVVIQPDLAAFAGAAATGGSQDVHVEQLEGNWFDDKSLFLIRNSNLGMSVPANFVAIVESEPRPPKDRNLVIAKKSDEVLARRVLFSEGSSRMALSAETPDPRKSPPTKIVSANQYGLHKIVGCLMADTFHSQSKQEAVDITNKDIVKNIETAYRVNMESAVPFALPNQILLGGKTLLPSEYQNFVGSIVAVTLGDGTQVLKRIGESLSNQNGYIRHFETIGGLGGSILLQTEEVDGGSFNVPLISSVRLAIGVIYDY